MLSILFLALDFYITSSQHISYSHHAKWNERDGEKKHFTTMLCGLFQSAIA